MEQNQHAAPLLDPKDAAGSAAALLARSAPVWAGTLGLNGRPQVRPIRFLFQQEGALYFLTAKSRRLSGVEGS